MAIYTHSDGMMEGSFRLIFILLDNGSFSCDNILHAWGMAKNHEEKIAADNQTGCKYHFIVWEVIPQIPNTH